MKILDAWHFRFQTSLNCRHCMEETEDNCRSNFFSYRRLLLHYEKNHAIPQKEAFLEIKKMVEDFSKSGQTLETQKPHGMV